MWDDLNAVDPRFDYSWPRGKAVRFPLVGIGGGFSVSGCGRLVDWSIRNRPALQGYNGYSHFAVMAELDGKFLDARVLNSPYDDAAQGDRGCGRCSTASAMARCGNHRPAWRIAAFPRCQLLWPLPRRRSDLCRCAFPAL